MNLRNSSETEVLELEPVRSQPEESFEKEHNCSGTDVRKRLLAIRDAMSLLGGKWKIIILGTLSFKGKHRFKDLQRDIDGIGAKMLSKELHDMELNLLVSRTVLQTRPITVEYAITPYGRTLEKLITEISEWGLTHRERIMKGDDSSGASH